MNAAEHIRHCAEVSIEDPGPPGHEEKVFDSSKIDFVSVSADRNRVRLYVVNDSSWTGSEAQIQSLQAKIHGYISFALDGQLAELYPETLGLPWEIVIDCQVGSPDARSREFLDQIREPVRRYGGDLVILCD